MNVKLQIWRRRNPWKCQLPVGCLPDFKNLAYAKSLNLALHRDKTLKRISSNQSACNFVFWRFSVNIKKSPHKPSLLKITSYFSCLNGRINGNKLWNFLFHCNNLKQSSFVNIFKSSLQLKINNPTVEATRKY